MSTSAELTAQLAALKAQQKTTQDGIQAIEKEISKLRQQEEEKESRDCAQHLLQFCGGVPGGWKHDFVVLDLRHASNIEPFGISTQTKARYHCCKCGTRIELETSSRRR